MPRKPKFTALQRAFVAEFVRDKTSAKAAAIRAGVEPAGAKVTASRWLNDPEYRHVQDAVDIALSECLVDAKATRRACYLQLMRMVEGVIPTERIRQALKNDKSLDEELEPEELALIAGFTMSKFAAEGVTVTVKQWNKLQAINLLLKHFGAESGIEAEDQKAATAFDRKMDGIVRRLELAEERELAALMEGSEEAA